MRGALLRLQLLEHRLSVDEQPVDLVSGSGGLEDLAQVEHADERDHEHHGHARKRGAGTRRCDRPQPPDVRRGLLTGDERDG